MPSLSVSAQGVRRLIQARNDGILSELVTPLAFRCVKQLDALSQLCGDVDCSLEFGFRNGHNALLSQLCSTDQSQVEKLEELIDICTHALPPGYSFPLQSALDDKFPCLPAAFDFNNSLASPPVDARILDAWTKATTWEVKETAWCRHVTELPKQVECSPVEVDVPCPQPSESLPLIMLRSVPSHLHKLKSQDDVGQLLWPAAAILARWVIAHRFHLFRNTDVRVLELGSGLGLAGIAALHTLEWMRASVAAPQQARASVTLSDFNPLVLHNMVYNLKLNALEAPAGSTSTEVYAAAFDWMSVAPVDLAERVSRHKMRVDLPISPEGPSAAKVESQEDVVPPGELCLGDLCATSSGHALSSLHAPNTFDLVVGSDIICSLENAFCVAASLKAMLRKPVAASTSSTMDPGGLAVVLIPSAFHRWGVEAFPDALHEAGLECIVRTIHPCFVHSELSSVTPAEVSGKSPKTDIPASSGESTAIAGGYEKTLQLYMIRWPPTAPVRCV